MSDPILYAKAGGPPDDWINLGVRFNGEERTDVLEANVTEGWIRVYLKIGGRFVIDGDEYVDEKSYGKVEIYRKVNGL